MKLIDLDTLILLMKSFEFAGDHDNRPYLPRQLSVF
jgi:hypothetical protein